MEKAKLPIGMLDSGVGGLSVASSVRQTLPNESLVYIGDTAHFPYGTRSAAEVLAYVEDLMPFFINHTKLLVLACNTASAVVLTKARGLNTIPIIGVIVAGAKVAAEVTRNGHIGVLATQQTIKSGAYTRAVQDINPSIKVTGQAAPKLVELVETGQANNKSNFLQLTLEEYVRPLIQAGVDTLVLGCTHFLPLQSVLEEQFPSLQSVINPAAETALQVKQFLTETGMLRLTDHQASAEYFVTGDDLQHFYQLGSKIFGEDFIVQRFMNRETIKD